MILVAEMAVLVTPHMEMAVGQAVRLEAVEVEGVILIIHQAEQEPEARCVYGLGDSEYSRAIWPGCAEA